MGGVQSGAEAAAGVPGAACPTQSRGAAAALTSSVSATAQRRAGVAVRAPAGGHARQALLRPVRPARHLPRGALLLQQPAVRPRGPGGRPPARAPAPRPMRPPLPPCARPPLPPVHGPWKVSALPLVFPGRKPCKSSPRWAWPHPGSRGGSTVGVAAWWGAGCRSTLSCWELEARHPPARRSQAAPGARVHGGGPQRRLALSGFRAGSWRSCRRPPATPGPPTHSCGTAAS